MLNNSFVTVKPLMETVNAYNPDQMDDPFRKHLADNFFENWKELQVYMTSELFDASSALFIEKQLGTLLSLKLIQYVHDSQNNLLKEHILESLNYSHLLSTSM
jgi:hypothetical protein